MYHYRSHYAKDQSYYKKPFYKTKGFLILLAIIAIASGFVFRSISRTAPAPTIQPKYNDQIANATAKLILLDGSLKTKAAGATSWSSISAEATFQVNTALRSDSNSRAIIQLPDKSIIRLSENSQIKFLELGNGNITIEQTSGRAFHRVNPETTAIYRVKNNDADMIAIGTSFDVLASNALTYITVIDSKVHAKVFNGDSVVNMRTIESGTRAQLNTTLPAEKTIKTENITVADLVDDSWIMWNIGQDKQNNFPLGLFANALKLNISQPSNTEITTAENKITIKGQTETDARVFIAGREINNDNGTFTADLALIYGENKIDVVVQRDKEKNKQTLTITSTTKPSDGNSTANANSIILSATVSGTNVNLSWNANDAENGNGFKTIIAQTENPTYPGSAYHSVSLDKNSDAWTNLNPGDYHFRVCLLQNNQCVQYSNDISATVK